MKTKIQLLLLFVLLGRIASFAVSITSGPYLQNVTSDGVTIVWSTDVPTIGWVEIAPDNGENFYGRERPATYDTKLGRAEVGTLHKVRLSGLEASSRYLYRVYAKEVVKEEPYHVDFGRIVAQRVQNDGLPRFATLPKEYPDTVRFAVVNDIHQDGERYAALVSSLPDENIEFMVFNGDMVNYMDSEEQYINSFLAPTASYYGSWLPTYMVRGNHESRGNHAREYMRYFDTPTSMPYYSFRRGPVAFIVLDGGEDKPDSDIEYSGTCFCDDYRLKQAQWLKEAVEAPEFKDAPYRIVLVHVPPTGNTWHGTLHARELFLPILNEANIDLMLSAHLHRKVFNEAHTDSIEFPVLINSNKHCLTVEADPSQLNLRITDTEGKVVDALAFQRRK